MLSKLIDENLSLEEEEKDAWRIKDDVEADWVLDKLKDKQSEFQRIENTIETKIMQLTKALSDEEKRHDNETSFFKAKLQEYFQEVNPKETKTQKTHKLPSGVLKEKKESKVLKHDKEKLVGFLEKEYPEFVKVQKVPDWASFKKNLAIEGDTIINKETGEVVEIEGLEIEVKPSEFKVEI